MKRAFMTAALLAAMVGSAAAQQPAQQPFTPYKIDQKTHEDFMKYLGELPAKYAIPMINDLNNLEQAAALKAALDAAAAKRPPSE